jgi:hypothetical protein
MDKTIALLLTPEEVGVILSSLIGTSQCLPDEELAPELVSALSKVTKVYSELRLQSLSTK